VSYWLGEARRREYPQGRGKNDSYEVFKKLIRQGRVGPDFSANWRMLDEDGEEQNPIESPRP
jgi:hypothetical protein